MRKRFKLQIVLLFVFLLILTACDSNSVSKSITLDSPAPNADWPQAGHDAAQTAFNSAFTAINKTNVINLRPGWVYHSEGPLTIAPVVAGNSLYLNDGKGQLLALDRTSGSTRWTFKYTGHSTGSPVVNSDRVWFATDEGVLYSLNSSDGKQIWQHSLKRSVISSPSFSNGVLYIATLLDAAKKQPPALLAVNPENGNSKWEYELPASSLNDQNISAQTFHSTPPVASDAFFLPDRLSQLSGGVVRVSSDQKNLSDAWANPDQTGLLAITESGPTLFTTLVHGGSAEAVNASKALAAPLWYYSGPPDVETGPQPNPGAFADHTFVYVVNDYSGHAHIIAVGEDGTKRWESVTENRILSAPSIANGLIYLGDEAGQISTYELSSGKKVWQYPTNGAIRAAVVPAGEMIYVTSGSGSLYAFSLTGANNTNVISAPGQNGTLAVYAAPDQKGVGQIYALKEGKPVQLTQGDFATVDPAYKGVTQAETNRSPAISPDGKKIAFVSFSKGASTSSLYIMDVDGSNPQPLADSNSEPIDLAWTPDNQSLMFVSGKDSQLYSYNFGKDFPGLHALTSNYYANLRFPQASPDNNYIFWEQNNRDTPEGVGKGRIVRIDRNGQNLNNILTGLVNLTGLAVSPTTGKLAYTANDPTDGESYIWSIDAQGSSKQRLIKGVGPLDFTPDGRLLYAAKPDSSERLALSFDLGGQPLTQNNQVKVADQKLSWIKPASNLAPVVVPAYQPYYFPAASLQNSVYGKYVFSSNGVIYESDAYGVRLAKLTPGGQDHDSNPKLSPDGAHIIFVRQQANGKPQIWGMDALGQSVRQLTDTGSNTQPAWSGDTIYMTYINVKDGSQMGQVWTLNVGVGQSSAKALTTTGHNYSPTWSPDNKTIFYVSDRNAKTVKLNGVSYPSLSLYQMAPDGTNQTLVNTYKVEDGWLGVTNLSFQIGGRYLAFNGFNYQTGKDGKTQISLNVGVRDILGASDLNNNTNCIGLVPTWVGSKELSCILTQPSTVETANTFAATEPAGTWAKGGFDATKKPDGPAIIMLDPRHYQISGLSWSAK